MKERNKKKRDQIRGLGFTPVISPTSVPHSSSEAPLSIWLSTPNGRWLLVQTDPSYLVMNKKLFNPCLLALDRPSCANHLGFLDTSILLNLARY